MRPLEYVPTNMAGIDNHIVCANPGGHLDHVVQLAASTPCSLVSVDLLGWVLVSQRAVTQSDTYRPWINVALTQIESAAHSSRRSCSEHPDPGVMNLKPGPPLDDVVQVEVFELRSNRAT